MTESSKIKVGIFEVGNTAELREAFAMTHDTMSASLPAEEQFSSFEQIAMMESCHELPMKGATERDVIRRESDLCELMHYLDTCGIPVTQIHGDIRTFTPGTRALAMRLMFDQKKAQAVEQGEKKEQTLEEKRRVTELIFRAPAVRVYSEAMA